MVTVIFDLDHTLLNSKKLKQEISVVLGITTDQYQESYDENFSNKKIAYSFKKHLEILRKDKRYMHLDELKNAESRFEERFKEMNDLLFDGAADFVNNEKLNGNEVVLLTFGNREWQEDKINRLSEITDIFEKENIKYETEEKSESENLKELAKKDKIKIINDNIKETIKMVKAIHTERERLNLNKIDIEVVIIKGKHSEKEFDIKRAEALGYKFYDEIKNVPNSVNPEYIKELSFGGIK